MMLMLCKTKIVDKFVVTVILCRYKNNADSRFVHQKRSCLIFYLVMI